MAYEQREGQGSLFRADKKGNEQRPDYEGSALVGGVHYRIAAWLKEGPRGKWMSLKLDLPKSSRADSTPTPPPPTAPATATAALDDDIPF